MPRRKVRMNQAITDYGAFLKEAKQAVTDLNEMQQREAALSQQLKQNRKQLEVDEKAVADHISQTVKRRATDIASSYDKELSKGQERLKKAKTKREKAKSQGIKERIAEETATYKEQNRQLNLQMKTIFQQNHVPSFCRSKWYYYLYSPRRVGEFGVLLLTLLLCFLGIPCGSYLLIPERKPLYLVLIYFACIIVFGGLYVMVGNKTRDKYAATIKEGRKIRDQIHSNDKKIKRIIHDIKHDKNEAIYNLQKHDDEIARIEQMMSETAAKKKEALNTFETVTRNIIIDEITANNKDKLDLLRETCEFQENELKNLDDELKTQNLFVTDKFGAYLEKEFLHPQRLDALLDIVQNGAASNLNEAMDEYKKRRGEKQHA